MIEVESMATQGHISRPGAWSFPDCLELGVAGVRAQHACLSNLESLEYVRNMHVYRRHEAWVHRGVFERVAGVSPRETEPIL
jgi:hypothetical protein